MTCAFTGTITNNCPGTTPGFLFGETMTIHPPEQGLMPADQISAVIATRVSQGAGGTDEEKRA